MTLEEALKEACLGLDLMRIDAHSDERKAEVREAASVLRRYTPAILAAMELAEWRAKYKPEDVIPGPWWTGFGNSLDTLDRAYREATTQEPSR
jgi:hypothetical protein